LKIKKQKLIEIPKNLKMSYTKRRKMKKIREKLGV